MGFKEDAVKIIKSAGLSPEEEKAGLKIVEDAIKAESGGKEVEKGIDIMSLDEALEKRRQV